MRIELHELFSFYRHPQRHFFKKQLDLHFRNIETKTEEREPFSVARLEGYAVYHDWITTLLSGNTLSVKKLQAKGLWPAGTIGELSFNQQQQKLVEFVQKIRQKNLGSPLDDLAIDLTIGHYQLQGQLENRYQHGSLLYRYAKLKGKDFVIALLHHLISNQLNSHTTHLLSQDYDLIFTPNLANDEQLLAWLALYEQGQQHPQAFFVEAAFEYVKQTHTLQRSKRASVPALTKAEDQLKNAIQQDYEPELKLLGRNVKKMTTLLNQDFEQQCQQLLQMAWNSVKTD